MASTTKAYVVGQDEPILDGPTELAPDRVPSVDDTEPVGTYTDWRREDTMVITCRIGNDEYPGSRFETRDQAVKAIEREYGRIVEANYVPGRAFLRVKK